MRTIILIFLMFFGTNEVKTDDFCNGYENGFIRGYCYEVQDCIEPVTPLCPIPEINENTYEDGYNRGFLDGLESKE